MAFSSAVALNRVMAHRHTTDYRTLASLSRINLLHELQQHGSQTITQLAEATGLHHNTAREHLHRLIDAGFVDSEPIPSLGKGRPQLRYRAAQGPDSPAMRARRELSEQRTELMHKLLPVTDVSAMNTTIIRQLDALDDHMEECGFDAEIDASQTRMVMHDCPFGELAKEHPQVCEVHFALIKETLASDDSQIEATELHPFSGPNTCTVELNTRGEDSVK